MFEKPQENASAAGQLDRIVMPDILDVCCGPKGFWFDKNDKRAIHMDKRREVLKMSYPSGDYTEDINPDVICDFTDIQFPDDSFSMIIFDPPHIKRSGPDGRMTKRYGFLKGEWQEMLSKGFAECFRVLTPGGFLIFKWCEVQFPVKDILALTAEKPLFGHKSGKRMNTHWICFQKA